MDFGIGFNENLDAIENIKIASLILGIKKSEIKERTEHILDFSELTEFANLPLKYYSKGMRARLGFTTATEINPEILLLDEVFSGGDIHWLNKSTTRLENIIENASIVVIVTHSLDRIIKYCNRAIWLDKGNLVMDGNSNDVIQEYRK
jgi:ABC-type polysaccharide/polyol phosphate transport system ATPase subunit